MRALIGRIERIEQARRPSDWDVWYSVDDGRVRHVGTGETIARGDVDRRPGRHIVVEYVAGNVPCG